MESIDFLYIALGVGFLLLTIFGSIAIFYLIFILRDVTKIIDNVRETSEKVNEFILSPIKLANTVIERAKPIYEAIKEKKEEYISKIEEEEEEKPKNKSTRKRKKS